MANNYNLKNLTANHISKHVNINLHSTMEKYSHYKNANFIHYLSIWVLYNAFVYPLLQLFKVRCTGLHE